MALRTITQADIKNQTAIVRVDLNVPLSKGIVTDNSRITAIIPTIEHLLAKNCKIILCSHLGRPKGENKPELSLKQIIEELKKTIKQEVTFIDSLEKSKIDSALNDSNIVLIENTRFHSGEKLNDPTFAKQLADLADIYINDAFGTCHRSHASTEGITKYIPSYAGLLLTKEIQALQKIREGKTAPPTTLVIGGAKIDTKIGVLESFITKADNILIGGALANTFLLASGFNVGKSKVETDKQDIAQEIMLLAEKHHCQVLIPTDVIVADEISETAKTLDLPAADVKSTMIILDIGTKTAAKFSEVIAKSQTIIWNGPMGLYELSPFSNGTKLVANAIANSKGKSYIGGGDSIDAINKLGINNNAFTHISTGGGAMIEYIEGKNLPAIEALTS